MYREALKYLGEELDRVREMAAKRGHGAEVRQLFEGVTHPREALLRFGDTRVVMADDPKAMLNRMFARFVERDFADKDYHDRLLVRGVREVLHKANLRGYFDKADIGNEDLHLAVPFAHMQGGRVQLAIKPLDLAKDEASKVFDVGGRLVDRIQRLERHELLPEGMLIAVKEPVQPDGCLRSAVDEIEGDLRKAGMKVVPAGDANAIADFARAATLN